MKRLLLLVILTLTTSLQLYSNNRPEWTKGTPHNGLNYSGIASALKTESNYQEIATQRALRTLASQIKVTVSAESLLKVVERNGVSISDFEESISISTSEQLQGYRVVDTWQDENEYWIYYELSRFDYEDLIKSQREQAIATALDYWVKGRNALNGGNIDSAATLFTNGIESLSAIMHEDLTCDYNGSKINIASEIYTSLITLWADVTLTTSPSSVEVELLKGAKGAITIKCHKSGINLNGVRLRAVFSVGAGVISPLSPTNNDGESLLHITSITSKSPQQQIDIEVVVDNSTIHNPLCKAILQSLRLPKASIPLTLSEARLTAYIEEVDMAIGSLSSNINSMISNGYFDISSDLKSSDLRIKISSTFAIGREVSGDLYNTREYAGSLTIDIIDNRTQKSVGRYNIDRATALLPLDRSIQQAQQSVGRELLKRANRELPRILSQIRVE